MLQGINREGLDFGAVAHVVGRSTTLDSPIPSRILIGLSSVMKD